MLGLFATHRQDSERIAHLLERSGLKVAPSPTWSAFLLDLAERDVSIVAVPWLDQDLSTTELRCMVRERPWCALVLLTERDPGNLRLLGRTHCPEVLFLGLEERELPTAIRRAHLDAFFVRMGERIRHGPALPAGLRDALLAALEQEPTAFPATAQGPTTPARSVRSLALKLSRSDDYLARLARDCSFDLGAFLDWCIALRALELHWGKGEKWESVAWRLGYASVSGLSEQLKHTLGRRPREIATTELEGWFEAFEQRFLPAAAAAGRKH